MPKGGCRLIDIRPFPGGRAAGSIAATYPDGRTSPMADISEVAKRAATDPAYAAELLQGDEYQEVQDAIIADLQTADEVEGFNFQTSSAFEIKQQVKSNPNLIQQYVLVGPKPGGVNLGKLAGVAMAW
jgi:hypothetical protein